MRCRLRRFTLTKAVPLAISRGVTAAVEHLLVEVEHDGLRGWGETGGLDTGHRHYATEAVAAELEPLLPQLGEASPLEEQALEPLLAGLSPPARCGLDLALHDWRGKWLGQPLWRLWGLDPGACAATSVTLGLGSTEAVLARLARWWQQLPATRIKLKLGSPDGVDHDRALLTAVAAALRQRRQDTGVACELQVDANGGWTLEQALAMLPLLEAHGVVLLEQPLAPHPDPACDTAGFAALHPHCPLPLVADESCWGLDDLLRLAPHVDGINIKLLKSGGLSEALLMARTARRLGLGLMLGCYSDGSLLNGAAAQLLPLVRWPDLDSHLNLVDDPFTGLHCAADQLQLPRQPGLGIAVPAAWQGSAAGPLRPEAPVVVLLHGGLDNLSGKTGLALLRYRPGPIVAVVDPRHAGASLEAVTGIERAVPVVGSVAEALPLGPEVAVIGLAPSGGQLPGEARADVAAALRAGLSVASGLHSRIAADPELAALRHPQAWIWDLRQEPAALAVAAARAAALPCRRLLAVGSDMAVGKMSACLELLAEARRRGLEARFVGTGQAGILISGAGVPLDAVRVDYAAGAVEAAVLEAGRDLGPAALLLVEGQGSLAHPGSTATLPLLRGSQPTDLLLVHRAGQRHIKGLPALAIPPLGELITAVEALAALARPDGRRPRVRAVALNTAGLEPGAAQRACAEVELSTGLPCADPVRCGGGRLLDALT
ncbi:muconate cycloisomerase [Cyanobium sp. PCC 7001]|nr:muconate cycloisomerase [Cyanobium sp. PCC 7001]